MAARMTAGGTRRGQQPNHPEEFMEGVIGIGGMFFRAREPGALARWYAEHLSIDNQVKGGDTLWWQKRGPTVFAPFPADTDYLGRPGQAWMLNFRVRDLDAIRTCWMYHSRSNPTGWLSGSGRPGDRRRETRRTPWPVPRRVRKLG
jgi:hypothetical protein